MPEGEAAPVEEPKKPDDGLTPRERRDQALARHRFKPGQSGNPSGKRKGTLSITTRLTRELRKVNKDDAKGRRWIEILVQKLMLELVKDPVRAGKILERLMDVDEGPVQQQVALTGGGSLLDIVRKAEERQQDGAGSDAPATSEVEGEAGAG